VDGIVAKSRGTHDRSLKSSLGVRELFMARNGEMLPHPQRNVELNLQRFVFYSIDKTT
jgi:hypothetical protein